AVAQGIEALGRSGLWNAVLDIGTRRDERCRPGNGEWADECRILRGREVHVELPEVQGTRSGIDIHQEVRGTGRRRGAIEIGRQEAGVCIRKLEAYELRSLDTAQHANAV